MPYKNQDADYIQQKRHEAYLRRKEAGKIYVLPLRTCPVCDKEYQPTYGSQKACSRECARKPNRKCERCGMAFYSSDDSKQFCSRRCRRGALKRACVYCGKDIPRDSKSKYCSHPCKEAAEDHPLGEVTKKCRYCQQEFTTRDANRLFCSQACKRWASVGNRTFHGGYYRVMCPPETPGVDGAGRMLEHRWVMQQHLGRPLREDETVHHVNGDKLDNRLENLQVRNGRHGRGVRLVCADCGSHNIVEAALD